MDLNSSASDTEEEEPLNWTWILVSETILFAAIIGFTVIGNGLVFASVLLHRTPRSPTYVFIGNLALADLLVGLLVLPCNATVQITLKWYFGPVYCVIWHCIHLWLCSASILSICAICLDRFIGVTYPLKHFKMMKGSAVRGMILSVWILAFSLGVFPVFIWPEPPSEEQYTCRINQQFGLVMVVSVGIFYVPMSVMLLLYGWIFCVTKRHWDAVRRGNKVRSNSTLRIHAGRNMDKRKLKSCCSAETLMATNFTRQVKTAKNLTVVVGAFLVCYCPFFTVFLIQSLNPEAVSPVLFDAFAWLRYSNSAINPIIYAAMLPAFRKSFKEIVHCRS